ncbi:MAG: TraR/DksA C4-type zinc finger protein [Candidatus Latescibacterota bacterium]|jgi:RNA polymerase-binding protein DksA
MNREDLARFGKLIQEKLDQASAELEEFERISRSEAAQESSEDRSAYSLHMADRGTDAMEREKSLLFAQRSDDYIEYLQEALQRVEAGTYGACRTCGGEIGRARLEAVPTATQCIACKSKQESVREAS